MKLTLDKDQTFQSVQDGFHAVYPYLKLEFFSGSEQSHEVHTPANAIPAAKLMGQMSNQFKGGDLNIAGNIKVSELEASFHELTGIEVQVYRKSGRIWMQTTKTDNWTLDEQNMKSEDEHREVEPDAPMDYREMD